MLLLSSILFLIGGSAYGMYEEILALIPVMCGLMKRLGLGNEMAVGVSLGTASVASVFSPFNTFGLGISQPLAELPLFSGFAFRAVVFALAMIVWFAYLGWYAVRYRKITGTLDDSIRPDHVGKWKRQDIAVLLVFNGGLVSVVTGAIVGHWDLPEFGAIFLLTGFVAGLAGGLGWRATAEQLAEGFRRIALACLLIGMARAISVVLSHGEVLDTIANALFSPLQHLPLGATSVMMMVSESVMCFPMPSDSGRAMMSLPILIPLSDLLHLSRQIPVNAFLFGGLVSGLITPTSGAMLAMLSLAGVSFGRWLRFIAIPGAILFALAIAAMVAGVALGVS